MLGDWLLYFNKKKSRKPNSFDSLCHFLGLEASQFWEDRIERCFLPSERLLASFCEDRASKHVACNHSIPNCVDQSLSNLL